MQDRMRRPWRLFYFAIYSTELVTQSLRDELCCVYRMCFVVASVPEDDDDDNNIDNN